MLKFHYVYKTVNKINGKFYVGVHSSQKETDNYLGSGKALIRAIKKYGIENFEVAERVYFNTREKALEFEELLVDDEFCKRKDTYNMTIGGGCPPTHPKGPNPSLRGRIPWNKGRTRRLPKNHKGLGHNKGKVYTEEEKQNKKRKMIENGTHITLPLNLSMKNKKYWTEIRRLQTTYCLNSYTSRLVYLILNF